MGIDFSHCDARWAYSGFMRARCKLAKEIGIKDAYKTHYTEGGSFPEDDIEPLLNHSDCDGELSVEECKRVAPRLRELISKWPDDDFDKQQFLELAEGMEHAVSENEPLEFR